MIGDGYSEDTLNEVVMVMAKDNYPNNFTLDITVRSNNKIYYYLSDNMNYQDIDGNKDGYSNLVSYLEKDKSDYLNGDITLLCEDISGLNGPLRRLINGL